MKRLLVLLAVFGLLAASCGGSDSDAGGGSSSSGDALTLAAWIDAADAICKDFDGRIDDLGEPQSADELIEFFEAALPLYQEQREATADLGSPDDEAAEDAERVLELFDESIAMLEDLLEEADGDGEALLALLNERGDDLDAMEEEMDGIAADLGMAECGEQGDGTDDPDTTGGPDGPDTTDGGGDDGTGDLRDVAVEGIVSGMLEDGGAPMDEEQAYCFAESFVDEIGLERILALGFAADEGTDPFTGGALSDAEQEAFLDTFFSCMDIGTLFASGLPTDVELDDATIACISEEIEGDATMRADLKASIFGTEAPDEDTKDQALLDIMIACVPEELMSEIG